TLDPPYGTFEYLTYSTWGVSWYYGYKWSFTPEETSKIAILGVGGFGISAIVKLGFLKAIGPAGWILGYIGAVATTCSEIFEWVQ
ncbi:MAG: hypothetical protein ACQEQM_06920, partial [Thermoplasmatota archaeon]